MVNSFGDICENVDISVMLFAGDGSSGYGVWSIEKEKEKKKPQTFLLHSVYVCVCGDRKTKQCFGWK